VSRLDERRAGFQRYKRDVEKRGKPFWPYAIWHDTVMSFVVVVVIIALACIWYFTADGTEPGLLGPHYTEKADPGTTSFIPRPDWYFFFLFYLLRIFHWPESVVLGTVGVPTILLVLLLALPFLDVRRERRLLRRPVAVVAAALTVVSMGMLTYLGATAEEGLAGGDVVETWVAENNLPEEAVPGAELFASVGCQSCHQYLGSGSQNLGAPDLSSIGLTERGVDGFVALLREPPAPMPSFAGLPDDNLRDLGIFLDASRGGEG
jgi:menaquinol-cytochrome c reductase cytochrome b/c subunit